MSTGGACGACRDGTEGLPFDFTMAFQPIVDLARGSVWGYEALVRGAGGAGAMEVLSQVTAENRYSFDQACRVKAIELAGGLFPPQGGTRLSINFLPNAVYQPSACIRTTLAAAGRVGFDLQRIAFEFTENEPADVPHIRRILAVYSKLGFITAIDDFGAGFAGLALLADFQPDLVKIDMALVRGIAHSPARQAIVAGIMQMSVALGFAVLAEGVETQEELAALREAGVTLFQGYLFARPQVERLPQVAGLTAGT